MEGFGVVRDRRRRALAQAADEYAQAVERLAAARERLAAECRAAYAEDNGNTRGRQAAILRAIRNVWTREHLRNVLGLSKRTRKTGPP
jgi:hypothetical protein